MYKHSMRYYELQKYFLLFIVLKYDVVGKWEHWGTMLDTYVYPEYSTPDYSSILVPIVDNVRINYLINTVAKQERAVLLIGEQGSGKTVMLKAYMKKANSEIYMGRSFNFSSATSPLQFQVPYLTLLLWFSVQ
jgi:ABC-type dipeptide/oligopeptide/nickel transport system, ATPase component